MSGAMRSNDVAQQAVPPLCVHPPVTTVRLPTARGRRDEIPGSRLSPPSADGRVRVPRHRFRCRIADRRLAPTPTAVEQANRTVQDSTQSGADGQGAGCEKRDWKGQVRCGAALAWLGAPARKSPPCPTPTG